MSERTPDAADLASPAGRYAFEPQHTTIRFSTRHLFGLASVTGSFRLAKAELIVGAPGMPSTLEAVIDAASFDTGNPKRDDDVRSAKYLDVKTYPEIIFSGGGVRQPDQNWLATGTVTAHGIAAPVDLFVAQLRHDGRSLHCQATSRIDRYAHQVTAGKGIAARWLMLDITGLASRSM